MDIIDFTPAKEFLWTVGSIMGILIGAVKLREYFSRPKIAIMTKSVKLREKEINDDGYSFTYEYYVINEGKDTTLKILAEIHKVGHQNAFSFNLSDFFEIKKNSSVTISGVRNLKSSDLVSPPFRILIKAVERNHKTLARLDYEVRKVDRIVDSEGNEIRIKLDSNIFLIQLGYEYHHPPIRNWVIHEGMK